ncbi:MAG: hypothetical protein H0Z25_04135 [Kosmotoga sp.]|uniref:hypothetical protein n=1 Tax=Kosmotoga sp. TaxID=1955248 RepID=UPI001E0EEF41|nr:hypothetical protein [Kosmotoga sp.]MBO8166388.1 hypothetical protein [Kosmotoga sp.]
MNIKVPVRYQDYCIYTEYSGFISPDEILRINNEACGFEPSDGGEFVDLQPSLQEKKRSKKKVIFVWK